MDTSVRARVVRLLRRHRFAILGYSAEDETYCPQCLRLATGLSPHSLDTNGKPVLPLHACDPSFHDEVCTSCHQRLVDRVLFTNTLNETFEIYPGESRATEVVETITAKPPIIRRRAHVATA